MEQASKASTLVNLDRRVPRYTSYPPANHFNHSVSADQMAEWLAAVPTDARVSLYLHIPFCRHLCWFCACRTQGVNRLEPLVSYVKILKAEIRMVAELLNPTVRVTHLHLGGGTPTLLTAPLMHELLTAVREAFVFDPDHEFSVEIDPTEIDLPRLEGLAHFGLNRASIGIQDFNPIIQKAIGRPQSYAVTEETVGMLRSLSVPSINADILYGLPHQNPIVFHRTLDQVNTLAPDRIAMFGYAHVPWMARRQVMIDEQVLPGAKQRSQLLALGRDFFLDHGYKSVGIDHFAKPHDKLLIAAENRTLRRNFQGYTEDQADILIGMGASSISRFPQGYAQNAPGTADYERIIESGSLATSRGYLFSDDDNLRRYVIEQIMCFFEISTTVLAERFGEAGRTLGAWIDQQADDIGLTKVDPSGLYRLAEKPHLTARLVALEFDRFTTSEKQHSLAV